MTWESVGKSYVPKSGDIVNVIIEIDYSNRWYCTKYLEPAYDKIISSKIGEYFFSKLAEKSLEIYGMNIRKLSLSIDTSPMCKVIVNATFKFEGSTGMRTSAIPLAYVLIGVIAAIILIGATVIVRDIRIMVEEHPISTAMIAAGALLIGLFMIGGGRKWTRTR